MFSTFVVRMAHEPQVTTIPQFVQSLPKWYTIPQQRPTACFLYEAWSFKAWFEPYLRAVHGTSQPHAFRFELSAEGVTEMFTKDISPLIPHGLVLTSSSNLFLMMNLHSSLLLSSIHPSSRTPSLLWNACITLNHFRHLLLILWHDSIHLIHVIMSLMPSSGLITTAILLRI